MTWLIALLFATQAHMISVEKSRFERVLDRAQALPDIDPDLVLPNVLAAFHAETTEYPAELLLAIAWGESRFRSDVTTGHVCGVLQTVPRIPSDCSKWLDPFEGYQAGVDELIEWSFDRRTHGDLRLILLARACGNSAFTGKCRKQRWPGWVLRRARALGMHDVRGLI
jgi:hypothetical protein